MWPPLSVKMGAEPARAIMEIAEAIAASRREEGVGFVKSLPVLS